MDEKTKLDQLVDLIDEATKHHNISGAISIPEHLRGNNGQFYAMGYHQGRIDLANKVRVIVKGFAEDDTNKREGE